MSQPSPSRSTDWRLLFLLVCPILSSTVQAQQAGGNAKNAAQPQRKINLEQQGLLLQFDAFPALQQQRRVARQAAIPLEIVAGPIGDNEEEGWENDRPALPPKRIVSARAFDLWIFRDTENPANMHENLRWKLEAAIDRSDDLHHLTETQKEKLRLAGQGDIKHFFDEIENKRREFELLRPDFMKAQNFLFRVSAERNFKRKIMFDNKSIFSKTLVTILNERQQSGKPVLVHP